MNELLIIDAATYYAEKFSDGPPMLSQSMASAIVNKSPLHAWRQHPKLGNVDKQATKAMEKGTVVHDLLLGGSAGYEVLKFKDFRTDAAKMARDSAYALKLTPILADDYVDCQDAAAAVRKQLNGLGIPLSGQSEGVVTWTETADDGTPVPCKARIDHWIGGTIIDFKTGASAHPTAIQKKYCDFGYDIQAASNPRGVRDFLGVAKLPDFFNVFVEMEEPWLVTVAVPDEQMLELGAMKWRRAINLFAQCARTGVWPAYATAPVAISPTPWQLKAENLTLLEA